MKNARSALRLELRLLDAQARTAEASLSSDAPIQLGDGVEVLSHEPTAVDLTRAAAGLPLLFAHDQSEPIGLVEGVRLEGGRLKGTLRFGSSAKALEVWQDVTDGLLLYMSVGYRLLAPPVPIEGGYLIPKWMPFEASVVSVPLDASVGINRSYQSEGSPMNNQEVQQPAPVALENAERARIDGQIRNIVRLGRLEDTFGEELVRRSLTLEGARSAIFDELARRSANSGPSRSAAALPEYGVGAGVDDIHSPEGRSGAFAEVLAARCGGPAPGDAARQFMNMRCVDMARELLELRGIRTTYMGPSQIITRAMHGTSDFPQLLTSAGNRVLRRAYESYKGGLRRACKQSTARDFRAKQSLALGEAPKLEKVNEHGEFKRTSKMGEMAESYKLSTFGKIFGITRQALVNDDLDAFGQMNQKFGVAAAEFESQSLVDLLASNPTMGDGVALFHANHGNLAGVAAELDNTTLAAARLALRMQKGLDGATPIDVSGRYIIVPAALELKLDRCLVPVPGATAGDKVNLFNGFYDKIVDPRLDAYSTTAWYMSADPDLFDTIEYSYLEEQPGPQIATREGFDVDGMEIKVTLDFGCGALDFRGLYKGAST